MASKYENAKRILRQLRPHKFYLYTHADKSGVKYLVARMGREFEVFDRHNDTTDKYDLDEASGFVTGLQEQGFTRETKTGSTFDKVKNEIKEEIPF